MKSKKEESIMLIVLGLIGTPNMLVFIMKSFRGDDVLDTIFGYIMVAMLISFWVGIVIELIKSKRNNNKHNRSKCRIKTKPNLKSKSIHMVRRTRPRLCRLSINR